MTDNIHYVFIHGANQTSSSWATILDKLRPSKYTLIDYSSKRPFSENLSDMMLEVSLLNDIFFVAHSLGGIYAVHLQQKYQNEVRGAVTISTPYGGSNLARTLRLVFPSQQLFKDICPSSDPIVSANQIPITVPWTQVVSVDGCLPIHMEPNDGIVSIRSMKYRNDVEYVEVKEDHYSIIKSDEVVDIIKKKSKTT
jgi:pimeloyl-ACP methyl ester carboxylesterase